MMQLIDIFQSHYEVIFATAATNLEFSEDLNLYNVQIHSIELNNTTFDEWIKKINPDIVLYDRFLIEEQYGWRVRECCPDALTILNTEDLHSLREARGNAIKKTKKFEINDWLILDTTHREAASIHRSDVVLMISKYEIELLQQHLKVDESKILLLPIFGEKKETKLDFKSKKDFVFIGNFYHKPNIDAVNYLYKEIWPIIHKALPEVKMNIYGAYMPSSILQLHNPSLKFNIKGRADIALTTIDAHRLMLAPLRFGAGIKGKLIEAMMVGTPSITTSIGAEAMSENNIWNGEIQDDPNEFADAAIRLYQDEKEYNKSVKIGYDLLDRFYKKSLFEERFLNQIDHLKTKLKSLRNTNFIGAMLHHHTATSSKYLSKYIEEKNKKTL